MLSSVCLVYVRITTVVCSQHMRGKKQHYQTGMYVQSKASRTETREIVLSTPAGKKTLSARRAVRSAWIAPRPRPMCPVGFNVSEYSRFCRKVLVRTEKLAKVRKIDKCNTKKAF